MKLYEFGFFLLPALLAAQEYRGTILGRVVDPVAPPSPKRSSG